MTDTVRFAPSPTGRMHIGNARTAILNWLLRLKRKGVFILRYDDTDVERSKQEFADGILEDLQWLGITPDRIEHQSKRFERYLDIAEELKLQGAPLPMLRDARRARTAAQTPARPRPAADLRPRRARPDRGRSRQARKRGPQAALAVQARSSRRGVGRPNPRPAAHRHGDAFRSGSGAGRWKLPLHAAVGGGRHRFRRHARHSRRRPCGQHGRADRDFRNAVGSIAAFRASQPAHRGGRQRPVEAAWIAFNRINARERP